MTVHRARFSLTYLISSHFVPSHPVPPKQSRTVFPGSGQTTSQERPYQTMVSQPSWKEQHIPIDTGDKVDEKTKKKEAPKARIVVNLSPVQTPGAQAVFPVQQKSTAHTAQRLVGGN